MKPTQKQVIAWAREAGYGDALSMLHSKELKRFANLVAAAEREACAKACESDDWKVAAAIVRARREQ